MPLNIPGSGGGKPWIRFSPAINAWQLSGEGGAKEFAFDKPAVFDIQNVQLGWLLLAEGQRDWQPWPGNRQTPKPAEGEYKAGFELDVYSTQMFGEAQVRQFSSNGTGPTMFVQELYNLAEKAPEFAQGMSPVVQITGSKAIKVGKGTTRVPQFVIQRWVPRPAALSADADGEVAAPAPAPAPAPAAPAPAPAAKAAAGADQSEF